MATMAVVSRVFSLQIPIRKKARGMAVRRDLIEWVGGYHDEPAKAKAVFDLVKERSFVLSELKTARGYGNSHFVFEKAK